MRLTHFSQGRRLTVAALICLVTVLASSVAMASTTRGTEFAGLWTRVTDYLTCGRRSAAAA